MNTLEPDDDLNRFCSKFEARAKISREYYRRARHIRPTDWNSTAIEQLSTVSWDQEPMIEITLPQDRFRHLIEMDRWADRVERDYQGARQYIEQEERRAWVRQKDPRVAKAYERYMTLLRLVERDYD